MSRRFSPSWESLQIDSDSTPLTSETPTRASPIKSLLWFPLLIINASELSGAVMGSCLWGFLAHVHIYVSAVLTCCCGSMCRSAFFFKSMREYMWCFLFMDIHGSFEFHVVSASCLWQWLPHNRNWKAIKRLPGNWRWHIEFQQEIWRGASFFTAEVDSGKAETVFQEKCAAANNYNTTTTGALYERSKCSFVTPITDYGFFFQTTSDLNKKI